MWITLTPSDLASRFSRREMDAMRRASEAFDDAAAQAVLDQTADTARGYVAAWSKNRLAAAPHSLPPALRSSVLDIAVVEYSQSVGGALSDPKDLRQKACDRAYARLLATARGEFAVEQPVPGEAQEPASASNAPEPPTAYDKRTSLSRLDQKGSW